MVKGVKSKQKLKLDHHRRGISRFFKNFSIGDRVIVDIDPSSGNMPHPRFQGYTGEILGKRGRAYLVKIKDKFNEKILILTPNHLRKLEK